MSYILEALKKAQAERQIGNTPTIHAPTLSSMPVGQGARSKRTPVIVAMALMVAAIAGLATMLVRQQSAANQPVAPGAPASAAAAAPTVPAEAVVPAAPRDVSAPDLAGAVPAAATQGAAQQAPVAMATAPARADASPSQRSASAPASIPRTADARGAQHEATPAAAETPQPQPKKQTGDTARVADVAQAVPIPPPPPAPAPVEEQVQSLRELPEPIQRAIPQVTLGGYMYSKNPADRLLLIDKVLRREGEEVAPGLILDKLQPKQAIFSFRGYRYRVPL